MEHCRPLRAGELGRELVKGGEGELAQSERGTGHRLRSACLLDALGFISAAACIGSFARLGMMLPGFALFGVQKPVETGRRVSDDAANP
jgi:hypothetical protein